MPGRGTIKRSTAMSNKSNATIATMGIDIGKNSFHIVGLDRRGAIVLRQKWSRGQVEARLANIPPCLIGMEACVGAHHLSRKLQSLGHDARLMPARYVRAYLKGQKNDFRDGEAIAEAVQRPRRRPRPSFRRGRPGQSIQPLQHIANHRRTPKSVAAGRWNTASDKFGGDGVRVGHVGIEHDGGPLEPGSDVREQLKPLASQRGFEVGEAGDVPAGAVEPRDDAGGDGIDNARKDDRDRPRLPLDDKLSRSCLSR
jgi:hypothetical protein